MIDVSVFVRGDAESARKGRGNLWRVFSKYVGASQVAQWLKKKKSPAQ